MSDNQAIRDRNGDLCDVTTGPTHHWRCNGHGWTRGPIADRLPVPCAVCRPHLVGRVGARRSMERILAS